MSGQHPEMVAAQVGVVGLTSDPTPAQLRTLREVLLELVRTGTWELHIADAPGASQRAHEFWRACRQRVVLHPSRADGERARLAADETRPALPARERDVALIAACQALVVVPSDASPWEQWTLYASARRRGLALFVVRPSGDVQQWSHGLAPPTPDEMPTVTEALAEMMHGQ